VRSFKNHLFQNHGPILTRLGTNYPWVEGIQVCSNEGDSLSPKGDNKRVKIHSKKI
jgi:hypothetical protein